MYCQYCGNEVSAELKYCNRCGANLLQSFSNPASMMAPPKLTAPALIVGLTIIGGLGVIFGGASEFARDGLHPAAITWIVLFSMATLFGCTALLIRFWTKLVLMQRQTPTQIETKRVPQSFVPPQLTPRLEPVPSVTEHTTRTFAPAYREPSKP